MTRSRRTALTALMLTLGGLVLGFGGSVGADSTVQPNRLVADAERLTFRAQPTVIGARAGTTRVRVSGVAQGARAGEAVAIQAKTCGLDFFRVVGGAVTEAEPMAAGGTTPIRPRSRPYARNGETRRAPR
jgi:hypothetical protein